MTGVGDALGAGAGEGDAPAEGVGEGGGVGDGVGEGEAVALDALGRTTGPGTAGGVSSRRTASGIR